LVRIHRAWSITVLANEGRSVASQEELVSIVEVATCDMVRQFALVRSDAVNLTDVGDLDAADSDSGGAW